MVWLTADGPRLFVSIHAVGITVDYARNMVAATPRIPLHPADGSGQITFLVNSTKDPFVWTSYVFYVCLKPKIWHYGFITSLWGKLHYTESLLRS